MRILNVSIYIGGGGLCFLCIYLIFFNVRANRSIDTEITDCSIMTFNIDASDDKSSPEFWDQLVDLIEQEKPDICCFQELSFENLNKIKPRLDSIYGACEQLKGDDQLWRLLFYSHFPMRNYFRLKAKTDVNIIGLDTLSIAECKARKLQMPIQAIEFEIQPNRWVRFFSGHLRSSAYSTARRSMDDDANWFSGIPSYWKNYQIGKHIRDYEADNVRIYIDEALSEDLPVLMAGDFNDWERSYCLKTIMKKDLKDAWKEGGKGFGWTYFGWGLRLRLDHILYSDEFELVDVRVIDSDLSDHKPLVARFIMK